MGIETALIGGALGLGGSLISASAQKSAAKTAAGTAGAAIDWQKEMYYDTKAERAPWVEAGKFGLSELQSFIKGGYDVSKLPSFQSSLGTATKDLNQRLSSLGLLRSGAGAEAYGDVKSKLVSSETSNYWNRLAGLAGIGQAGFTNAPDLTGASMSLANLQQSQGGIWQGAGQLPFQAMNTYSLWNYLNKGGSSITGGDIYGAYSNLDSLYGGM